MVQRDRGVLAVGVLRKPKRNVQSAAKRQCFDPHYLNTISSLKENEGI
jgi:hypothetical protein